MTFSSPTNDSTIKESFADFDRRIAFSFGALFLSLMMIILLSGGYYYHGIDEREQNKLSKLVSNVLAESVNRISFSGKYHSRLLLEEIANNEPDILYITVSDKQGQIQASSQPSLNDTQLDAEAFEIEKFVLSGDPMQVRTFEKNGNFIREITVPYLSGINKSISGVIQVGFSEKSRIAAWRYGLYYSAAMLIILMIVGIVITRRISRRLGRPVIQLASDLAATLQAIPDLMFELDLDGRYLNIMSTRDTLLYSPRAKLLGRTVKEMLPAEAANTVHLALETANQKGGAYGFEIMLPIENGESWFELSVSKKPVKIGEKQSFIVLSRDVTERKNALNEIHHLAFYDPLTKLPNRRLLYDRLHQALSVSTRSEEYGAAIFLDLDHFKTLNDTKGHDVGDKLLRQVAERLLHNVREGDTVARLGGDEFVVILESLSPKVSDAASQAGIIAEKLRSMLAIPYVLDDHEFYSSASLGVTLFKGNIERIEDLLKHADTALYEAKSAGRNTVRFFDPEMQADLEEKTEMINNLRYALEYKQLHLNYQIQINSANQLIGVEALLRWDTPEYGLVSPIKFIPLAEESGLIIPIGLWVLKTACEQIKIWSADADNSQLQVAVNVSPRQFRQDDFVSQVKEVLESSGIEPGKLKIELTESLVLDNIEDSIQKMHELKSLGVSLSMDDFGTGYSSLSYLKKLPLDQLKIDQSFVRDIVTDPNDAAIVQAIITMGHAFGLQVIAEGVETEAQRTFLKQNGCHAFQGFLFSKPMSIKQLDPMLILRREQLI